MISLTCTHCQAVLQIDDAFAGGVCRCQHCGTIQTVPSHLKNAPVSAGVGDGSAPAAQKALYQSQRRATAGESTGSGTGLEDLADVVASSGLADSGLSSAQKPRKAHRKVPAATTQAATSPDRRLNTPILLAVFGAALALIVGGASWYLVSGYKAPAQPATPAQSPANPDAAAAGPQFCGVPLAGSSIVFLLDRGDSAKEVFDGMKEAAFRAIETLGPDKKFQVLLWDNDTADAGYPAASTTYATPENLDAARRALDEITAEHQSNITRPLAKAVTEAPDGIVIVTAKGFELDDSFVSSVLSTVGSNPIKLYTISLRTESSALQTLAKRTGGIYKMLSDSALRNGSGE
jgi:hypothetical protein